MVSLRLSKFPSSAAAASSLPPNCSASSSPSNLRSLSNTFIEESISNAESTIAKWHPGVSLNENRSDAKEFLSNVNQLQKSMQFLFGSANGSSQQLIRAQRLIQIAMDRLKEEFRHFLASNRGLLEPASFSSRSSVGFSFSDCSVEDENSGLEDEIQNVPDCKGGEIHRSSALAALYLRSIAESMINSGYGIECAEIYKDARRSVMEEALRLHVFERINLKKISKLDWAVVEKETANWLVASKIAVLSLFAGERFLCDQIFAAAGALKESCLAEVCKGAACDLFKFPAYVAEKCKKSPEKLFLVLNLYDALSEQLMEIESIFSYESTSAIRLQVTNSMLSLRKQAQSMFSNFLSKIQKDPLLQRAVPGGGVHPLTLQVMNYVSNLNNYRGILASIFADQPFIVQKSSFQTLIVAENNPFSPIADRIAWLILVLLCKLDGTADVYKDVGLSYLFLANNLHHIVSLVRKSDLRHLLGECWLLNHEERLRLYSSNYVRASWAKVASTLLDDPTATDQMPPGKKVKEAFHRFNSAFEAAVAMQREWLVPDESLRESIQALVVAEVVPAYRDFYLKHQALWREEHDLGVLVRFSPMDLENRLSKLLSGSLYPHSSL